MKNSLYLTLFSLFVAVAYGAGIPTMDVTVSEASGKVTFKGRTAADGTFATGKVTPGHYVVQFNAKNPAVKGNQYALVIAAGKRKVSANAVAGEKFAAGGVAMRLDVASELNITGQIAADSKTVMKNGKKMVWIPQMIGSNLPGHWAEEGSAEEMSSRTRGTIRRDGIQRIQDKGVGLGPG